VNVLPDLSGVSRSLALVVAIPLALDDAVLDAITGIAIPLPGLRAGLTDGDSSVLIVDILGDLVSSDGGKVARCAARRADRLGVPLALLDSDGSHAAACCLLFLLFLQWSGRLGS